MDQIIVCILTLQWAKVEDFLMPKEHSSNLSSSNRGTSSSLRQNAWQHIYQTCAWGGGWKYVSSLYSPSMYVRPLKPSLDVPLSTVHTHSLELCNEHFRQNPGINSLVWAYCISYIQALYSCMDVLKHKEDKHAWLTYSHPPLCTARDLAKDILASQIPNMNRYISGVFVACGSILLSLQARSTTAGSLVCLFFQKPDI